MPGADRPTGNRTVARDRRRYWLRAGLLLAATELAIGGWAMCAPAWFWPDFPLPGHPWTSRLPAYNGHLMRDFGAFNVAFALMFGVAAVTLGRLLSRVVLLGYLVFGTFHLAFQRHHLTPFGLLDVVGQVVSLAGVVVLCVVLLALTLSRASATARAGPPVDSGAGRSPAAPA